MNKLVETDLEDVTYLFEDLLKRLHRLTREQRIDVAARLRAAAKHIKAIDDSVKAEVKKARNHKAGIVKGEKWVAQLSLVPVKRLDQGALKDGAPETYEEYCKEDVDERVTFEVRG
jgi:predicted RNA binding protein with dsRBD fold (UPF0201 family)